MEAYSEFANVYDIFMEDTPYQRWFEYITREAQMYGTELNSVCELGCGTGKMTLLFAKTGAQVIGIDYSPEMLMVAQDHAYDEEAEILYLMQDMSQFDIGQQVDLICSCCDSINYLLEEEQIKETFKRVNRSLNPNGLFIFDLNTAYKYAEVLGDRIFADQNEHAAYVWENYYDAKTQINEYEVSFFIEEADGRYARTIETHYQRAYDKDKVKAYLEEAGFEVLHISEDYSEHPVVESTQRMTFTAKKRVECATIE